jgi:hypothetical protein
MSLLTFFLALSVYFVIIELQRYFRPISITLFLVLIFLFSQRFIGRPMTEYLGVIFGNLSLVFFLRFIQQNRIWLLITAFFILTIAMMARTAAIFILPMLAIWVGIRFRGKKKFSFGFFGIASVSIILGLLTNVLVGEAVNPPGVIPFSNFAYILYGQAHGGGGWTLYRILSPHLGDPTSVFLSALHYIRHHPVDLFLGIIRSFADFFRPGIQSDFGFITDNTGSLFQLTLWTLLSISLIISIVCSLRNWKKDHLYSFIIFSFIGIMLSIPVAPPRDSASLRTYATTMPFFFILIPIALDEICRKVIKKDSNGSTQMDTSHIITATIVTGALIFLSIPLPLLIKSLTSEIELPKISCRANEAPFYITVSPFSFIGISSNMNAQYGNVFNLETKQITSSSLVKGNIPLLDTALEIIETDSEPYILTIPNNPATAGAYFLLGKAGMLTSFIKNGLPIKGCMTLIYNDPVDLYLVSSVTK